MENNRANTYKKFCKYRVVKMADPIPSKKLSQTVRFSQLIAIYVNELELFSSKLLLLNHRMLKFHHEK